MAGCGHLARRRTAQDNVGRMGFCRSASREPAAAYRREDQRRRALAEELEAPGLTKLSIPEVKGEPLEALRHILGFSDQPKLRKPQ